MADKNRGQDPGDDVGLSFDMEFDDAPKSGRRPEQTFGADPDDRGDHPPASSAQDTYDEFESMPEPGQNFGAPAIPQRDEFGDLGGGHEMHAASDFGDNPPQGFGQDDPVENFDDPDEAHFDEQFGAESGDTFANDETNVHAGTEDDDEAALRADGEDEDDEVAPEAARRSLMSRLLAPAIGLAGAGLVGWLGWIYVSPFFIGQPPVQQAQVQQPRIQTQPQAAMPTPPGQLPPLPSGGQMRSAAVQQAQRQAIQPALAPSSTSHSVGQPPATAGTPSVAAQPISQPPASVMHPASTASAQQAPQVPTGMNRPGDDALAKIFGALDGIAADVKGLSRRVDAVERAGSDMRADLSRRMDDIDASAKNGTHIASAAATGPAVNKTSAPPLTKAPPAKSAATATHRDSETADDERPARVERSARRSRHAKSRRTRPVDYDTEDRAEAGDEPPAKPRVIGGYRLKGVSEVGGRSIALIRTKRGLEEVTIGQTLAGGGEVRSIRQNGGSWVVVTSRGVIIE